VPGLLSTPALGAAVFAYQFEIQQAREAAAKSGASPASEAAPAQPATDAKAQKRNLSLNSIAMDISGKETGDEDAGQRRRQRAMRGRGDAAERTEAAGTAAQHHSEDLPRRGAGGCNAL